MDLSKLSDRELVSDVVALVGSHRELTAKLVAHLGEIEDRRLHLRAGYSSMFAFCQKKLGMSEGEAFRRIRAARLGRRFPVIHSLIATGAVHLSTLQLLRELLTEENHTELLEAVSWKSKRQVEELMAARFPRPAVPSKIYAEPVSPVLISLGSPAAPAGNNRGLEGRAGRGGFAGGLRDEERKDRPRSRVEPLSDVTFRVEFTASAELCQKLQRCRDLMSHANPSRDIGAVVEHALDRLLADLEKKRLARTKRPRRDSLVRTTKPGRITNATRRAVFERDGEQCTYFSPDGRRCEEQAFLELDHIAPRALGGSGDASNLRVRCRAHNQLWAEEVFGREEIARARHFRQQKQTDANGESPSVREDALTDNSTWERSLEKVHKALTRMGFRAAQARLAVASVRRAHVETEPPTIEDTLREAILAATENAA